MANGTKFSETIKSIREQLSMTQKGLARELGVSFATINRWENGHTEPSRLALVQFQTFCDRMKLEGKI